MCKQQPRKLQRQVSWRKQALEVPFDCQSDEIFNCLFACSRKPKEQAQIHVRQLLLWDWIQSQDGECIFGVALAKAMLSKTYRGVLFTVVDALVPVWNGNDSAQRGETVFAHLPQFCWSFPRFAGCLVSGCQAMQIPMELGDLLAATDCSGGVYAGTAFQDCLERSFVKARARWLSGQIKRQNQEDAVSFAAHELLRNFTAESHRLLPNQQSCWLYLFHFVESVHREHLGRIELDGSACLAREEDLVAALRLFLTTMTHKHAEMRDNFLRSESYWRWSEALDGIRTVDWAAYSEGEEAERVAAVFREAFAPPRQQRQPARHSTRWLARWQGTPIVQMLTCSRLV